jgi:hypothetical protein
MSGSSAGAAPSSPAARLASFRSVLGGEVVDLSALRALAYALGIPEEERGLRALVWKVRSCSRTGARVAVVGLKTRVHAGRRRAQLR